VGNSGTPRRPHPVPGTVLPNSLHRRCSPRSRRWRYGPRDHSSTRCRRPRAETRRSPRSERPNCSRPHSPSTKQRPGFYLIADLRSATTSHGRRGEPNRPQFHQRHGMRSGTDLDCLRAATTCLGFLSRYRLASHRLGRISSVDRRLENHPLSRHRRDTYHPQSSSHSQALASQPDWLLDRR
jgi:hypothetical protein